MAQEIFQEFVRVLPSSTSTKTQLQLLNEVIPLISKDDCPEPVVKTLLRVMLSTSTLYQNVVTRRSITSALVACLQHHKQTAVAAFFKVIESIAQHHIKSLNPSRDKSASCLLGLKWSCIIAKSIAGENLSNSPFWPTLSSLHAILYDGAMSAMYKPIQISAYKKLTQFWKVVPHNVFEMYFTQFEKSDKNPHMSCGLLATISLFNSNMFVENKSKYWDYFIKSVVMSKVRPHTSALTLCAKAMKHIHHDEFKSIFLPSFKKALLRSPENVIATITSILSSMSIDLSNHAVEVVKMIGPQLASKDVACREETAVCCATLAFQCSDSGAVEEVTKYLFAVLKGSHGNLSLPAQKVLVVASIGNMAKAPIGLGQTATDLSKTIVELLMGYYQQDTPEAVAKEVISSVLSWGQRFHNDVPSSVTKWFKKLLDMKNLSSSVKITLLECIADILNANTYEQASVLTPQLMKLVDKAISQTSQWAIVTEGLVAANILCKMASHNIKAAEIKQSALFKALLDSKKQIFTSDKLLHHSGPHVFNRLLHLCESLLIDFTDMFTQEQIKPYCDTIISCLLHMDHNVRKNAAKLVHKLHNSSPDFVLGGMLLESLSKILQPSVIIDLEAVEVTSELQRSYVPPKRFESALQTLLSAPQLKQSKQRADDVAFKVINDCYHPCIMKENINVWTDFLYKVDLDAEEVIRSNIEIIKEKFIKCDQHTEASLSAFSDLVRISPHEIMPLVVSEVRGVFNDPRMSVSKDDMGILNTPPGELYNLKAVLSVEKIAENKNIKRENKLYSHSEQIAAIQYEKELKAKKAKEKGVAANPLANLNKKQQTIMEQEIEKEDKIRKELMKVRQTFDSRCKLLETCFSQKYSYMLSRYVPSLSHLLLSLTSSHLTSYHAQKIYLFLREAVIPEKLSKTGLQMCYLVLRLLKPVHEIDESWLKEDVSSITQRIILHLQNFVKSEKFSAPCFSYVFEFLLHVLRNGGEIVNGNEDIIKIVLEITLKHAKLQHSNDIESDPRLLPMTKMLDSMSKLIGISTPELQELASDVFVNTCHAMCVPNCDYNDYTSEFHVVLESMKSPVVNLRLTAINGLNSLVPILRMNDLTLSDLGRNVLRRVWVMMHDSEDRCKTIAANIWNVLQLQPDKELCTHLLEDVMHHEEIIQESAAASLYNALDANQSFVSTILTRLVDLYAEKLYQPPPTRDNFGRVIYEVIEDDFQSRIGIALALTKLSPLLDQEDIKTIFKLFVPDALRDRHPDVRAKMLDAALQTLNDHAKNNKDYLLSVFEEFLKNAPTSESFDSVRQSVVILMGTLARHLDKNDPKIKPIAAKLTEALSTPSQQVQEAIAKCLPPLVPAIRDDAPDIVRKLIVILLESEKYGERKGAAYGLAGMIKGLGIIALKQLDVITTLTEAIQDKNFRHKEGALFAFEMLCSMLGRLFEPYIVNILPHLLLCFGDKNEYVREAADETAKTVMANLSAHGVKLILPSLLSALKEDSWRTKTGSVDLLGAMAFCAPKQLSSCLPNVVPKLCEVITDSHPKVQKAGQQALKQIGSVIRNPEIKSITPMLLSALSDPSRKTAPCLEMLLNTKFVHFIDAPSLALILPVVHRAFQDRSTDTRKMAAQIIRNMYSLTDQKDLNPYLPSMVPGLKNTLLDPVPEVRAIAAKALGSMVKGTGESLFEELLPWLMDTITSEQSSVDRSGAAQGLSEVLFALGTEQLKKLMPQIIQTANSTDVMPHVRDGYVMMFIFLPTAFKEEFTEFIGDIIPIILLALSDETEFLRETALHAGQRVISMYAETAISLLLPELEKGLFDDNWRIRLSSIQLLGDLLFHISGVTGKMSATGAEDDNFGTTDGLKTIKDVLGEDRSHRVLAGLYMGRLDVALLVRQAALHVWKIVVPNTARLLREILTTLFQLLISCLSSSSYDKRQVAAKTLGDVVRKLGERMLPQIIPILEDGLQTDDADQREGVCVGLSEIIKSCSKDAILTFTDNLVPSVCRALCDEVPQVRKAAATTFENLHTTIGVRALEDVLPNLLDKLNESDDIDNVIDGLRQMISVKGRVVMPFIIPKLIQPPINTFVLAHMSAVAGESLSKHLSVILKALLTALEKAYSTDTESYNKMLGDCETVVLSVEGEHGTRITIDFLLESCRSHNPQTRFVAITLLSAFCKNTEEDYSDYVSMFIRTFFKLLADEMIETQVQAWEALSSVTKQLDAVDMLQHVSSIRQAIRFVKDDLNEDGILPGFCMPKKGLTPVIPIFREGILNGSPDHKEQAAKGLGDCVKLVTAEALKPSVVSITGPLIRILGDRFGSSVRVSVLDALAVLLYKAGIFLKPFLPQLQTTFSKALQDSNRPVRLSAAAALRNLVLIHPRLDPLFTDLNNNIKSAEEDAVRETTLHALRGCIKGAGHKMGASIRSELTSTLCAYIDSSNEIISKCAAGCLACMCAILSTDELSDIIQKYLFVDDDDTDTWELRQGRSLLFAVSLLESHAVILDDYKPDVIDKIKQYIESDRVQQVENGVRACCYALVHTQMGWEKELTSCLQKSFRHSSNDIKITTCDSVAWLLSNLQTNKDVNVSIKFVSFLVSEMLPITREKNTTLKSSAEYSIIEVINLREENNRMEECSSSMNPKDSSLLAEVYKLRLKRLLGLPSTVRNIDNTVLPAT